MRFYNRKSTWRATRTCHRKNILPNLTQNNQSDKTLQIYTQTSEIISSLLEYFTASAVYIRYLYQIHTNERET